MIRFSSLVVVVFLLSCVSSYASKVVDVDTICKNVDNSSFCLTLLKSKHGADLVTLAQYTIDVTHIELNNTINLLRKLISQSGGDPKAKAHYEYCLSLFGTGNGGAISSLKNAQQYLKNGDYFSLRVEANNIIADHSDCINGGTPGIPAYPDKSILPKYAEVVFNVADIMLFISLFLTK